MKMLNICQIALKIYLKPDMPTCNPSPVSLSQKRTKIARHFVTTPLTLPLKAEQADLYEFKYSL